MKKAFLLVVSFVLVFCFTGCEERFEPAPKITEGEFPFVLEYEMDGQRYLIEDKVVCRYNGNEINPFPFATHPRTWRESLKSGNESKRLFIEFEPNTESLLVEGRINTESRVILYYGSGGYYLGDPNESHAYPYINYVEQYKISENESRIESTKLSYEQLEKYFGIKILKFEFSSPIKNKF